MRLHPPRPLPTLIAVAIAAGFCAVHARGATPPTPGGLGRIEQREIEALPDGGTLVLPAGRFRVPPGGLIVDRQIAIEGAHPGPNRLTAGTFLVPSGPGPVISIREPVGNVTLRDLIVDGERTATHGIEMRTETRPTAVTLERVTVWHATSHGIVLTAADTGSSFNLLVIRDCISNDNGGAGLLIRGAVMPRIEGGFYSVNGGSGVRLERCAAVRLRDVYIEANVRGDGKGAGGGPFAQLHLRGGTNHVVDGCVFEDYAKSRSPVGVIVEGAHGTIIQGCMFINPRGTGASTGVSYRNASRDNWLGPCTWRSITTPHETQQGSTVEVARTQAAPN